MTLDIIVPHYKETKEVYKKLFESIALQRGVCFDNICVTVINDGKEVPFEPEDYPYQLCYVEKDHAGVSAARNEGLKLSTADYVMFCDADDMFLSNYGLHQVFSAMQTGADFIYSDFVEETFDKGGNATITRHDGDLTFMHGKVYKRSFLLEHDLWFDPVMNIHEDGYFNMICYCAAKNAGSMKHITTPFYLWCWNDTSVVRSNRKDFVLKTYKDVMLTRDGICEQLKARGYEEDYVMAVLMTVLNSYYDFQKTSFHTAENAKYLRKAEDEFKWFWKKYKSVFYDSTNLKIAEVAEVARNTARNNGFMMEMEDLKSFLKRMS